jgi:hypothetical protein
MGLPCVRKGAANPSLDGGRSVYFFNFFNFLIFIKHNTCYDLIGIFLKKKKKEFNK